MDTTQLTGHIHRALQDHAQITLRELTESQPLRQGLAELVVYLQLGSVTFKTAVDEDTPEQIRWRARNRNNVVVEKMAQLPRIIFLR